MALQVMWAAIVKIIASGSPVNIGLRRAKKNPAIVVAGCILIMIAVVSATDDIDPRWAGS